MTEDIMRAIADIRESKNDAGRTDEEKKAAREQTLQRIRQGVARDVALGRNAPGRGGPRGVPNRVVDAE